jgi:diacylglycerol kinase (ATP)
VTVHLIANPAAGRGYVRDSLPAIRASFASRGIKDVHESAQPGDERAIAERLVKSGATVIVAVGGDGTCANIANAIVACGDNCALGVVPCGTGNDIAKTLGVDRSSYDDLALLTAVGRTVSMDVGEVDGNYFLNSCGFGFDPAVLATTKRVRMLKGDAVYIYAAVRQLLTYRAIPLHIESIAGADARKTLMLTVSNGAFLGGAFRIAAEASAIDGKLDLTLFGDAKTIRRIRLFARALRGTHLGLSEVQSARAQRISLQFSEAPMMEIDGELRQARSSTVEIECMPRALNVIAAPGFPR